MGLIAKTLLNHTEQNLLIGTIKYAESLSSGEIRVHLEDFTHEDVFDRASELFVALNMQNTINRNGVLIYVAVCQHKFTIIGDGGIHHFVQDAFWEQQASILKKYFRQQHYFEGLAKVVKNVGNELKEHFPLTGENPNELPDTISFG